MKKVFVQTTLISMLLMSLVSGDALKNSLTSIMNQKEKASVVDLGEINLNAKSRPPIQRTPKKRSNKAVVATINGKKVIKKDADAYLKQRTNGKVENFDLLPKKQQKRLIEEMALPIVITKVASDELSEEEKLSAYTRTWMRKKAATIEVTDEELLEVYNQMKQKSIDNNVTMSFPEFDMIKDKLKMQIIERTIVGELLKTAKFQIMP
jgi:hypothetical protein